MEVQVRRASSVNPCGLKINLAHQNTELLYRSWHDDVPRSPDAMASHQMEVEDNLDQEDTTSNYFSWFHSVFPMEPMDHVHQDMWHGGIKKMAQKMEPRMIPLNTFLFNEEVRKRRSAGEDKGKRYLGKNQGHGDPPKSTIQDYCAVMKDHGEEMSKRLDQWKIWLSGSVTPWGRRTLRLERPHKTQSVPPSRRVWESENQRRRRKGNSRPTSAPERAVTCRGHRSAQWWGEGKPKRLEEAEPRFRPTINRKIPNFERLQRRFQEKLERRIGGTVTVCEPFHLHTTNTDRHRMCNTWREAEEKQRMLEKQRRLETRGCSRLPAPPTNKASQIRQEAIRSKVLHSEKLLKQEKQREVQRCVKQRRVTRQVRQRLPATSRGVSAIQRKLQEFREMEKERIAEYLAELRDIQERVNRRPFLFEWPVKNKSDINGKKSISVVYHRDSGDDYIQEQDQCHGFPHRQVRCAWNDDSELCSPDPDRLHLDPKYYYSQSQ
ncbi:testis-specific protein 10-interacting protein [Ascaphus truei]|uniref:testis-specific protein 10-interacting protein n=1 Tax=Ascaphus truei TaxID=8439 RepID=UPI003F5A8EB1